METVVRARADKGVSSNLDAELASASVTRLVQVELTAERAVATTGARLAFLLGREAGAAPVRVEGDLLPLGGLPDTPTAAASGPSRLDGRPEVQAAEAERSALLSRADELRRSRVPSPTISAFVQNDGFNERVFGVGLAIPIPLPAPVGHSYAGEIAEADARAERAAIDRARLDRELQLRLAEAQATYAALRRAVDALPAERMRRAEDTLRDLQVEVEAGRLGIKETLTAQQALIELLQTTIEQRRALCAASVDLARALGMPLEGGAR
jgi:cobalt-zinc-cadmium efflux system outer membrane protein